MKPFRPFRPEPPPAPLGGLRIAAALTAPAVALGSFVLFEAGFVGETALLVILLVLAAGAGVVLIWLEWAAAIRERGRRLEIPPPHDVIAIWPLDEAGLGYGLTRRRPSSVHRKPPRVSDE